MRLTRTTVATIASVLWLLLALALLLLRPELVSKMTPNEWGDFFAGVFAPLAFLWLVVGYMQQGEELRLSTEALRLQAEELRNSVEQQRALVEVSRLQVESEREALSFERSLREDLSLPKFSVQGDGGSLSGTGRSVYNFVLSNSGHAATDLVVTSKVEGTPLNVQLRAPLFDKGAQRRFQIVHETPLLQGMNMLVLEYIDGLGRRGRVTFSFRQASTEDHGQLTFTPAEA